MDSIMENPYIVTVPTVTAQTSILPVAISNRTTESGEVAGKAEIFIGKQAISPTFDSYVHQANKTTAYVDDDHLEVKGNSDTHTREAYLSFPIDKIDPEANRIVLRAYYYDCIYPSWVRKETHPVGIAGNTQQYTTMTWDTKPTDFTTIGETKVLGNELDSYVEWNVTDWVKEQIEAQQSLVTLQLKMNDTDATGLLYFYSSEADDTRKPQLLVSSDNSSGYTEMTKSNIEVYTRPVEKELVIKGIDGSCLVSCYSLCGQTLFSKTIENDETIQLPANASGVYLLQLRNATQHHTCKIVL